MPAERDEQSLGASAPEREERRPEARTVAQFMAIVGDKNFGRFRTCGGVRNAPQPGYETLCYRGQSDSRHALVPSVTRACGFSYSVNIPDDLRDEYERSQDVAHNLLMRERALIDCARTKLPDVFGADMPPIELLAAMQHYGLPTRLLDVTDSPLVALYFACCAGFDKKNGHDGLVTVFRRGIDCPPFPVVNALADTYRFITVRDVNDRTSLREFYEQASDQPYYRVQRQRDLKCFSGMYTSSDFLYDCCRKRLIFVYPPNRFMRQVRQQAGFILSRTR